MQLNPLQQATSMSGPLSSNYNTSLYYGYSANEAPQEQLSTGSLELSNLNLVAPPDSSIYTGNTDVPATTTIATSQAIHNEPGTNNQMNPNTRKNQFEGNKPFIL